MNKKATIAKEALVVLVTVVLTSAAVFGLVKLGLLNVEETQTSNTGASMLNTEFMPFGRGGNVVIQNFKFCDEYSSATGCNTAALNFLPGDEVHFFFEVLTTPYYGDIILVENYRLISPSGKVLLEVEEENNYYYETTSNKDEETVYYSDYFILSNEDYPGTYTLDLVIENPMLEKEVVYSKTFDVIVVSY
ncbi:MAG: hypothetical protein ABIG93_03665 [archaeon]|nr:hypothetical protein [Nanoarchaeota archaeon]